MGKRIIISEEEIKSLPVTTNKISVEVNYDAFFDKYAIVSYYSCNYDKDYKNLAYEKLFNLPFTSVCGIKAKWSEGIYSFTKFFILIPKGDESVILDSLRTNDKIRSRKDMLNDYDETLKHRIIASLCINSLGKVKKSKTMYNNGTLFIGDEKNFLVPDYKKELVCLKIEINEYLTLTAKTTSLSHPKDIESLRNHSECMFQESNYIDGELWSGQAIKPVVAKTLGDKVNFDKVYIIKKNFSKNHNNVPYWPYNAEDYTHGKLFAITQVVDSVNELFEGLLSISFTDFQVIHYDEYKTEKDTLNYIEEYFKDKSLFIVNPFGEKAKKLILKIRKVLKDIVPGLLISKKQSVDDLILKLCEPIGDTKSAIHYSQSMNRLNYCQTAIQHKQFYDDEKQDSFSKSEARRILIELLVKNCLKHNHIPPSLGDLVKDWNCVRYKINYGNVIGATFSIDNDNNVIIKDFGFPGHQLWGIKEFAEKCLLFSDYEKINGTKEYMALKRKGNVYLIIDTDEIPILDAKLIDQGYYEIVNNDAKLYSFKCKKDAHKYLRGYMGFHLWKTDGIGGETNGSYSYISGFNSDNMKIMNSTKMDKMPRVRRIFVLNSENPNEVNSDIMEIANMLKFGFGRWNEMMTYPFPFKFLQEYLDDKTETAYSKHWSEISSFTKL